MRIDHSAILSLLLLSADCRAFSPSCQRGGFAGVNEKHSVQDRRPQALSLASDFVNDGPFDFLTDFLEVGGIEEGKKITWGVIPQAVDSENIVPEEEALRRRQIAAENLTNIDDDERDRREVAGDVLLNLSTIYATYLAVFVDDGGISGHFLRLTLLPLFALAYGYKESAKVCNNIL